MTLKWLYFVCYSHLPIYFVFNPENICWYLKESTWLFDLTWLLWIKLSQSKVHCKLVTDPRNWAEISANPGRCVFECVYGESHGLIRKNIRSGHSKMVLKYCAVSTLPHHLETYSWGTQHEAQPFTTVLLLAASSLWPKPGINTKQRSGLCCNYLNCSNFARLLMNTFLVIVQNTDRSIYYPRIQLRPFLETLTFHLGNLGTTWAYSKAPTSHFLSLERNMPLHILFELCDSNIAYFKTSRIGKYIIVLCSDTVKLTWNINTVITYL